MSLPDDRYHKKRQLLIERTARALAVPEKEAIELLQVPRIQSVRINTLKQDLPGAVDKLSSIGVSLLPSMFLQTGMFVESGEAPLKESALAQEGGVYIQNAASWLPVLALQPHPGESILDMCAAPGGKTSHIAQEAGNQALITANDNSRPRLMKLQHNLQRLGVDNTTFTLHDATRLAHIYKDTQFDKILLDAPCSGEGMMQLNNRKDYESWSVAHIKRLQQLQKKLIVQAWLLLKPGGTLVYSTCTMAPEENEAVIDYLARRYDDVTIDDLDTLRRQLPNTRPSVLTWNGKPYNAELQKTLRLAPSPHIEAFYVARLTKSFEA